MRSLSLLLVCILFLSQAGRAQYIFNSLQSRDGLAGKEVHCTFKDSEGFIWFGTSNGLSRFDGSNFKTYNQTSKKYIGLKNQTVYSVVEYGKNMIWTATTKGLFRFSKDKEQFDTIQFLDAQKKPLAIGSVEKLLVDKKKQLWIASKLGLFIYKDGYARPVSEIYPGTERLNNKYVPNDCLKEDTIRHGVWVGTVGNMSGLFFINYQNGETWSAWNNPKRLAIFDSVPVQSFIVSKKGDIWVNMGKYPLSRYSFQTNSFEVIHHINDDARWNLVAGCNALFVDSKDRLWVSSWMGKVFVKEPGQKFFGVLPDDSPSPYQLPVGAFFDAYEDDQQNLWFGTYNGVSKLSSTGFLKDIIELPLNLFDPSLGIAVTNTIKKAGTDSLWICKDDGVYLLDLKKTGPPKRFFISKTEKRTNRFFDMQWINGEWWCGTGDGVYTLNIKTGQFTRFAHYAKGFEVNQRSAFWIQQDRRGFIWFAVWGEAVYRYDPVTKITTRINELGDRPEGVNNLVNCLYMYEHSDGKIWLANGFRGFLIYDPVTNSYSKPGTDGHSAKRLDDIITNSIVEDKDKNLWISSTNKGILKLDKKGNILDSIMPESTGSEGITALIMDKYGKLWITTSEALYYINPGTKVISKLNADVGPPLHDPVAAIMTDGDLLFAAIYNKLAIIGLPDIEKISSPASPMITGISVFGNEIPFSIDQASLELKHTENFFVIEFSSPDHREVPALQYAYRLKGFDKDWVYCGRRQTASYTNVPDGNYTFMVKCTDANGEWIVKETMISINIQPPFWKRWWFVSLVVLLSAAGIWQLYKMRRKRQREKNMEMTIDYFANSVYGENSVNEICWDIARNCISQLHFEDCVVYLANEDGTKLVQKAAYGPKNPKGHEIENPLEVEIGTGIVGAVAKTGKPLLIGDTTKDSRYIVDDERRLSELSVPILHDGKVIGVIDSEHSRKNFFNENHLKTLTTIASISSNKIAEAQAEENAKQHEIKLLEINKLLAESQLMALRAQMNPHFVFNCLNSIQECIVTQKYGEASNYLNKFSKLFRTVLNNSGKNLVTLDEEKEVLQLYLELEQMRFEKSFSYQIIIDDELETDEILIPSMLLQPYVENALWHGLMHKEGERRLNIVFTRINEDVFRCVIDDNGIGRKRSFELKAEQSKTRRHESKGLKISKDRIDVLQKQGYHATLEIIDKTAESGKGTGTTVVIELSTFLKT